jgi:hypothetical protein
MMLARQVPLSGVGRERGGRLIDGRPLEGTGTRCQCNADDRNAATAMDGSHEHSG